VRCSRLELELIEQRLQPVARRDEPGSDERDAARRQLYDTTWPVPTADSWRTSSIEAGGLPDDVRSSDLRADSVKLGATPIFGITYDKHSVFVLGGAPHLLDLFTRAQGNDLPDNAADALADAAGAVPARSANPYVAKIDPSTMRARILELPKGTTPNYPGSIVAHRNGKLYAVATATLFEIDPETLEITRSLGLPLDPPKPESTIYNTAQISGRNGDLLLKTAPQQGTGLLVAVDVKSMTVRSQLETDVSTARMTTLIQGDTEYVYLPGTTETLRFTVTDDGFHADPSWSRTYRSADDGTRPGVAMTPTGAHDTVVFPNNNTVLVGVSAPLEIFWQSTTDPNSTVSSVNATSTDAPGGSFAPPPVDPFTNSVVVAADAVNGRSAAWRITDDGSLEKMWVTDRYAISVGAAIVADQRRLYTDDRVCDPDGTGCKLYLVVADLMTGKEIARIRVAGSQPSIGRIFIGPDAVYYIATQGEGGGGFVTKVTATRCRISKKQPGLRSSRAFSRPSASHRRCKRPGRAYAR
jgi:hypothetical protein